MEGTLESTLAARIATLRERQGLTQRALADAVGLDQSAVSRLEKGLRKVTIEELSRIATALDTTPAALINKPQHQGRLAAAQYLTLHVTHDAPLVKRLARLLEISDLVSRILQLDPPPIPVAIDPPLAGSPADQGQALARLIREKAAVVGDGPLLDLFGLAEHLGFDIAREPVVGQAGALVQTGSGLDSVLLCLLDSTQHPVAQRASLARLLCMALCRDVELLQLDTLTGECDALVWSDKATRAQAFARELLLPAAGLESAVAPPLKRTMLDGDQNALDAAAWVVSRLSLDYEVPIKFAVQALVDSGLLADSVVPELVGVTDSELLRRAELSAEWEKLGERDHGLVAPPVRTADAALAAYQQGLLGLGVLADLWGTDDKAMHEAAVAAGYEPDLELSSFDDFAL